MASLKAAIAEKCKQCTYDPACKGTWREQVESCTVTSCPLWLVRPVTVATINAKRQAKSDGVDLDALVNGLEDEEEVPA